MNVYIGEIMNPESELKDHDIPLYSEDELAELPISTAHRKVYDLR